MNVNSPLATYRVADTDNYGKRTHKIDTITPHCFVGQVTHKRGAEALLEKSYASANYVIGKDGVISVNVDEDKASMCSSNQANDQRAVTIEVASDTTHPYAVTDAAYQSLIQLMADICKRNGIEKLVWSTDKTARVNHKNGANITVHRDYSAKACPGDYLYNRMGDIVKAVNQIIEVKPMEKRYTTVEESPKAYQPALTELAELKCLGGYGDDRGIYLTEDMERIITILKRYIDKKLDTAPNADDIAHELANRLLGGDD